MPGTPPPLWPGYDAAAEDDLLALLDDTDQKASDPDDPTVDTAVAGALATAIARHEELKKDQDPDNYRPRLHERATALSRGWQP